jgi:hypothetical protein
MHEGMVNEPIAIGEKEPVGKLNYPKPIPDSGNNGLSSGSLGPTPGHSSRQEAGKQRY